MSYLSETKNKFAISPWIQISGAGVLSLAAVIVASSLVLVLSWEYFSKILAFICIVVAAAFLFCGGRTTITLMSVIAVCEILVCAFLYPVYAVFITESVLIGFITSLIYLKKIKRNTAIIAMTSATVFFTASAFLAQVYSVYGYINELSFNEYSVKLLNDIQSYIYDELTRVKISYGENLLLNSINKETVSALVFGCLGLVFALCVIYGFFKSIIVTAVFSKLFSSVYEVKLSRESTKFSLGPFSAAVYLASLVFIMFLGSYNNVPAVAAKNIALIMMAVMAYVGFAVFAENLRKKPRKGGFLFWLVILLIFLNLSILAFLVLIFSFFGTYVSFKNKKKTDKDSNN